MSKFIMNRSVKAGLPPGSPIFIGDNKNEDTTIEIFEYNGETFRELKYKDDKMKDFILPSIEDESIVTWINVDGLKDISEIEKVCTGLKIHTLVIEDILDTSQRAKIENYEDYLYIVAKMIYQDNERLISEQISIILGKGYVISFGEKRGDVFDKIRERIRKNGVHIRKSGADFLAYSILDAIIDGYFGVLELLGDKIEEEEDELLKNPSIERLHNLQIIKKDLIYMHKAVWPLREVASWIERDSNDIIDNSTRVFVRDLYDHIIQLIDTTETFRELLAGLMDVYLSSISNRMNEVMKVLTIISTIFIPLTFIAGVYGMNFKYMPELGLKWGYGIVIVVMVAIAVFMISYFKRKKWF